MNILPEANNSKKSSVGPNSAGYHRRHAPSTDGQFHARKMFMKAIAIIISSDLVLKVNYTNIIMY